MYEPQLQSRGQHRRRRLGSHLFKLGLGSLPNLDLAFHVARAGALPRNEALPG